jgi:hypothetical protein
MMMNRVDSNTNRFDEEETRPSMVQKRRVSLSTHALLASQKVPTSFHDSKSKVISMLYPTAILL